MDKFLYDDDLTNKSDRAKIWTTFYNLGGEMNEAVEGRDSLNLKVDVLQRVPDFHVGEWLLIQLGGNLHLVAVGTDKAQNRMKGFFCPVTPDLRILYEERADLCLNGEGMTFDSRTIREELLNFTFNSALKDPAVLAASFHPKEIGPNWTNTYVQVRSG